MYRFQEIFSLAQKSFGKSEPKIKANKFILNLARWADLIFSKISGKNQAITKASLNSSLSEKTYSNQKLFQFLQFKYTPVDAEVKFICEVYSKSRKQT
jgi:hypothetical protein